MSSSNARLNSLFSLFWYTFSRLCTLKLQKQIKSNVLVTIFSARGRRRLSRMRLCSLLRVGLDGGGHLYPCFVKLGGEETRPSTHGICSPKAPWCNTSASANVFTGLRLPECITLVQTAPTYGRRFSLKKEPFFLLTIVRKLNACDTQWLVEKLLLEHNWKTNQLMIFIISTKILIFNVKIILLFFFIF